MAKSYKELNQSLREQGMEYKNSSPATLNAFVALRKAVMVKGEVSIKNKELIATGIAIAARCDGCIASHVSAALKAGATRQELVETIDVAVLMGGGPSVTYGIQALAAVDELSA
ncbi:carboxymuconolactone decarboxylase family protein [Vibrio sp. RC27]